MQLGTDNCNIRTEGLSKSNGVSVMQDAHAAGLETLWNLI